MTVLCQCAAGRTTEVRVKDARTDNQACRQALSQLPKGEGWRAITVLS